MDQSIEPLRLCASVPPQISLSTSARPLLGTTIQQITSPIATGTPFGALMMSLDQATPPVDLTPYGMEGHKLLVLAFRADAWTPADFAPSGNSAYSVKDLNAKAAPWLTIRMQDVKHPLALFAGAGPDEFCSFIREAGGTVFLPQAQGGP